MLENVSEYAYNLLIYNEIKFVFNLSYHCSKYIVHPFKVH